MKPSIDRLQRKDWGYWGLEYGYLHDRVTGNFEKWRILWSYLLWIFVVSFIAVG